MQDSNRPPWMPPAVFYLLCLVIFIPAMYGVSLVVHPITDAFVDRIGWVWVLPCLVAIVILALIVRRRERR